MSLRLLIDEDSQDKILVKMLRKANHDVLTVNEAKISGKTDSFVLTYAKEENRILFTFNCDDFEALHLDDPIHPGILVVYHESQFSKNMSYQDIIRAINNLESSQIPLINQFISLNYWRY